MAHTTNGRAIAASLLLLLAGGCGRSHYEVLTLSDAGPRDALGPDATLADASPATDARGPLDAGGGDALTPTVMPCDDLTCTGIPGRQCLGDRCVEGTWDVLAFSERHACMIATAPGPVDCLGANDRGQLGDGTTTSSRIFVRAAGLTDAVRVFVGGAHTCAVDTSNRLSCWGANDAGQAGRSDRTDVLSPSLIGTGAFTDVSLGADHTCILEGTAVRCFGGNARGQLADGTTTSRESLGDAISTDVAAVEAGDGFTCVLSTAGTVACAGRNDLGQLGTGAGADRASLAPVPGIASASSLAAGDAFACASTDDAQVRCWGANDRGQLGIGTLEPADGVVTAAIPTESGTRSESYVVAGSRHAVVVARWTDGSMAAGEAWAWGDNASEQIAFGVFDPVVPAPNRWPVIGMVTGLVTGGATSYLSDFFGAYYFGALEDELLDPHGAGP